MKAISLTQPWADLIALGAKRIETRSWSTHFRGRLAIHASAGLSPVGGKSGLREQCRVPAFAHALRMLPAEREKDVTLVLGGIVAVATLVDVRRIDMNLRAKVLAQVTTPNEIEFGNYETGRFAWFLDGVSPLPNSIPCKGALGLWTVPADVLDAMRSQIKNLELTV